MEYPDNFEDVAPCPKCNAWVPDGDGFGVLAHVGPGGCGYCSHPSRDGNGNGGLVCGICGDVTPDSLSTPRGSR